MAKYIYIRSHDMFYLDDALKQKKKLNRSMFTQLSESKGFKQIGLGK